MDKCVGVLSKSQSKSTLMGRSLFGQDLTIQIWACTMYVFLKSNKTHIFAFMAVYKEHGFSSPYEKQQHCSLFILNAVKDDSNTLCELLRLNMNTNLMLSISTSHHSRKKRTSFNIRVLHNGENVFISDIVLK